ncbi:MAG: nickel-responsive transcriptional regulator NikR [Candidatus Margulisbacteria bacterium]|nr:nickel-responsive transcriptional regulator NikR [Candidatus Margulisiibacteriota bacterium]
MKSSRFGVSMKEGLLTELDSYISQKGYANRSEAIRDFIRDHLAHEKAAATNQDVVGTLTMVFNHDKRNLAEKLTTHQHSEPGLVISSTHIHLDKHDCLEVIILKGKAKAVRTMADTLSTARGVLHSKLILLPQK